MPVPSRLEVSFGQYAKSLIDEALAKLPSQFLTSCMLRQLVAVFVGEVQELYDAVLDMQRGRTLYAAEAANLDALGRIVGEERAPYQYSDSHWFAFDRMGQAWDSTPWWCRDAPLVEYIPAKDPVYRTNILARVIANTTSAEFTQLNATTAGKKDMEEVVKEAQQRIGMYGKKTILFVDEIHRFNKGQQDYLLPFVEDGTLVLIGATTENPYFEVNGALISRSIIFELKPLEKEDIEKLLERAVTDPVKGLGTYNVVLNADAKEFLADIAGGDARAALNAIELGVLSTERQADGKIHIDLETASECIQKRVVRYDKTGDQHYDTISAFIKSMRGSDPDAAVFYLAKMLYAGEDIKFIARRIMICAAEDVGLADPNALNVAVSASLAVERVGMPEAQIILAEAATYVACAPKSNSSCEAVFAAMKTVGSVRTSVPPHLQDSHYKGSAKLGHGQGYQYAHDYPNHYVEQQYLPDEILGSRFLHLGTNGYEQKIRENFKKIGKDIE